MYSNPAIHVVTKNRDFGAVSHLNQKLSALCGQAVDSLAHIITFSNYWMRVSRNVKQVKSSADCSAILF